MARVRKSKGVQLTNVDDTIERIKGATKETFLSLNAATKAEAEKLRDEVKRRAPVDTGKLRDQVVAEKVFAPRNKVQWSVTVKDDRSNPDSRGFVARFIELGTSKQRKRPFIRPAGDALEEEISGALAQALAEALGGEVE